jgi:hypothetical protein
MAGEQGSLFTNEQLDAFAQGTTAADDVPHERSKANWRGGQADAPQRIGDFGEKIGGARKDMWAGRGLDLGDLEGMNGAERAQFVTKDNVWPRPDYRKLLEEGIPRTVLWYRKTVRDACPTKLPRNVEPEAYVGLLRTLKECMDACREEGDVVESVRGTLDSPHSVAHTTSGYYYLYDTPEGESGSFRIPRRLEYAIKYHHWPVSVLPRRLREDADERGFLLSPTEAYIAKNLDIREVPEGASIAAMDGRYQVGIPVSNGVEYVYVRDKSLAEPGTWLLFRKHRSSDPIGSAKSREDINALANEVANAALEAEATLTDSRTSSGKPRKRPLKLEPINTVRRVGPDTGRDGHASGEDVMREFGIRGGEFGNWVRVADERQQSLDLFYDSLSDIADALGLDRRDMSIGGKLSIGFGSRGRGGHVLAHYEPGREVINITRNHPGSLAHEWIHALDDITGPEVGVGRLFDRKVPRYFDANDPSVPAITKLTEGLKVRMTTPEEEREKARADIGSCERECWDLVSKSLPDDIPEKGLEEIREALDGLYSEFADRADPDDPNLTLTDGNRRAHPALKWLLENCEKESDLPDSLVAMTVNDYARVISSEREFNELARGREGADPERLARAEGVRAGDLDALRAFLSTSFPRPLKEADKEWRERAIERVVSYADSLEHPRQIPGSGRLHSLGCRCGGAAWVRVAEVVRTYSEEAARKLMESYPTDLNRTLRAISNDRAIIGKSDRELERGQCRRVLTDFYSDAKKLDGSFSRAEANLSGKGSKGGYWSSDCELIARAGAAWIHDRISEAGITNDYLCGHAEGVGLTEDGIAHLAPQGAERKEFDRMFDGWVADLVERGILHEADRGREVEVEVERPTLACEER